MAVRLERSHNTDRALAAEVRPLLRGQAHRVAAILAWPSALLLVLVAPSGQGRLAAATFGVSIAVMFTVSAIVHYRRWDPHTTEVLFRLDHTGIYVAIAGTAVPVGLLAMTGWPRTVIVVGVPAVALAGIVLEWLPFRTPRGVAHGLYLVLGWATVPFVPMVVGTRGWDTAALLLGGGVLYTVGAVIVAVRRPDPSPRVFGYHEVWHLLVIAAVLLHWVMVRMTLLPAA